MKVYLQYPWKFPDSPYYKNLIKEPPEGIEYLNVENQKGVITHKNSFLTSNFLKRNIRRFFNIFHRSIPNAHLTKLKKENYDLIHCAHCVSKNKTPFVLDLEGIWQLYIGEKTEKAKQKVKEYLLKENCKRIMAWTEKTKRELLKEFPEVESKVEMIYPAVPEQFFQKTRKDGINLLFIARYFPQKGGEEAVKVMDYITKRNPHVNGLIISNTPPHILQEYKHNSKLTFLELIPQDKVFKEIYPFSDILIYPGYSDSFGFAYLEAMSFGIPIVTCKGHSQEEIIDEGKTGFIIQAPNKEREIEKMIFITQDLINNKEKLKEMSKNCIETIRSGKFSITERNKKIKRVYEEAIK